MTDLAITEFDGVFEEETSKPTEAKQVEPKPESKAEEDEGEEAKGDNEAAPPAEELSVEELKKQVDAFKAMALDEKRKRQQTEQQIKNSQPIPDPEDQPEEYAKFMVATRVDQSRDLLMSLDAYSDYEEKESYFINQMLPARPDLALRMANDKNPALFAYKAAQEEMKLQELKDPAYVEKLRQQLEAELREKLLSEMSGKTKSPQVPDLTRAAATAKNTNPKLEEIENIDEIFAD